MSEVWSTWGLNLEPTPAERPTVPKVGGLYRYTLSWGIQLHDDGKQLRAFVRHETPEGRRLGERATAWRKATPEELFYLGRDDYDVELEARIFRSFYPAPEDIPGELQVKWYELK